ncbi:hypothetical protein Q7P35_006564 [Cladosporium inversicolor]
MHVSAFLFTLCILAGLNHAQNPLWPIANNTSEIQTSHIALLTGQRSPLATGSPLQQNGSTIVESGMVTYNNATFATSCAYSDKACVSECSWHTEACSRTSADWWRTGVVKSMNTQRFKTETEPYHKVTQSLEVIDGYTYAMGPVITTESGTRTLTVFDPTLEVVSTLVPRPSCSTPEFSCTRQSWCNTDACTVYGGTVELLFWPEATATATASPGSTTNDTSLSPVALVTAMYKNMTLTSPSVYLEYKTAYALDGCSQKVGGHYPGALLALDPDDLYSIDARFDYFIVTTTIAREIHTTSFYQHLKMNYSHLTGLPDGEAYQAMPMCVASGCGIITPSLFHPQLVVPTQIRGMDPAWATCALDWRGSWDPPIALSKADSIVVPTAVASSTNMPPASSRPILDGPAKVTAVPGESTQSSLATPSIESPSSDGPSSESGHVQPSFTYSPVSPSSSSHGQPITSESRDETSKSTRLSVVLITTVVQIGQGSPTSSQTDVASEGDPGGESASDGMDGSATSAFSTTPVPETQGQQSSIQTEDVIPKVSSEELTITDAPEQSRHTTTIAGQTIVARPDGGLEIADTVLSAGGDPIIISSAVYSAAPGGALLIISESSTIPDTHSPTNAYEVLSEALGTAAPYETQSFFDTASKATSPSLTSGNPLSGPGRTHTPLPEAVLDLGSTTLTATQYPSGTLQMGSQFLNSETPTIVIDSHTLSTASNAIIFASTTIPFTNPLPTTQHPSTLTLSSTLLTAHRLSPSGAIELDSHTLIPGSSALVTEGHTLSAASSGLMRDGSLVAPQINSTVATSLQNLPSVQASYGSELPSVFGGPTIEGGGGEAAVSSGESSGSSDLSSDAGRLRHVPGLSWAGAAVFLLACLW